MTRILSIDWDYFVEEDPKLDYGHEEVGFFLNHIWSTRRLWAKLDENGNVVTDANGQIVHVVRDLKELLPFRGDLSMITNLPCLGSANGYHLAWGESHQAILQMLEGKGDNLEIVNIDAHHDLGYRGKAFDFAVRQPDCGSWGEYLIAKNRVASWKQVYPKWRIKFPEGHSETLRRTKKKLGDKFTVTTELPAKAVPWRKVDYVFVCRSGCWTPPVYDDRFNWLLQSLGAESAMEVRKLEEITMKNGTILAEEEV